MEWKDLENRLLRLPAYLSDRQIAKVQLNQVTGTLLFYPIYLLIGSMASLICYTTFSSTWKVFWFIIWLAATGGLGSAAFIYVNALSIQVDPTVDVVSPGLVAMRVVLGMLFAIILTSPFGFQAFRGFAQTLSAVASPNTQMPPADLKSQQTLNSGGSPPSLNTQTPADLKSQQTSPPSQTPTDLKDGLMLLLPFILGFSTPLVLSVLNRFVQSAQSFFGVQSTPPTPPGQRA